MFYIQFLLCILWLAISCLIAMAYGIYKWRDPSGGYIFAKIFTAGVTKITGVGVDIKNFERLDITQPCVYVGNHQSNIDMLIQANCYRPRTVCIGKKEIVWIPFFGLLFYVSGNIFLDRKNHTKAIGGMEKAKLFLMEKNISVYMFPEGTRNKHSPKLLPFKKGAFHLAISAQVPILPVVSCPIKRFIDTDKRKVYPGIAPIEVLDPIPTKGLTLADIDSLIETTHSRMQDAFERLS